jgi:hypothetical protein
MLREETLEKVRDAEVAIEGGLTMKEALKAHKLSSNSYYEGKKLLKKKTRKPYTKKHKPFVQTFEAQPAPVAQKVVAIIGTADQVRAFIGGM